MLLALCLAVLTLQHLLVMRLDAGALYIRPPSATGFIPFAVRGLTAESPGTLETQWQEAGFVTVMVTAVHTGDEGEALLILAARAARTFTEADHELVEVMANQIGKRYVCAKCGAELIVTKGGAGVLNHCGQPMEQKK